MSKVWWVLWFATKICCRLRAPWARPQPPSRRSGWALWDWTSAPSPSAQSCFLRFLPQPCALISAPVSHTQVGSFDHVFENEKVRDVSTIVCYIRIMLAHISKARIRKSKVPKRCLFTHVHCALCTVAKRGKQCMGTSVDEWTNKMWYVHTTEYSPAFKRKGVLTYVTTWMNFEDTHPNEISQ